MGGTAATRNFIAAPSMLSISCPKAKIDLAVADDIADQVIEAITDPARTGKIGGGKIFVIDVEQAIRIRTGETGAAAI